MKLLFVLALAVAVSAKSQVFYSHHAGVQTPFVHAQYAHTPIVRTPYVHSPYVHSAVQPLTYVKPAQPIVYSAPVVQTPVVLPKYHAASAGVSHTVFKREAEAEAKPEAEAEAEAFYPYATAYAGFPRNTGYAHTYAARPYAYNTPLAYAAPYQFGGLKTYSNDAVKPFGYANKGNYIAQTAGSIHIAKREAEAEPEADPAMIYSGAAQFPYTYPTTYASHMATPFYKPAMYNTAMYNHQPSVYAAHPAVYQPAAYAAHPAVYQPAAYAAPQAVQGMKTYGNHAASPWNYAAKGQYVADSVGARHVAKREAEPYLYNNYSPYSYSAYNTRAYSPYQYSARSYSNNYSPYRYSSYHY
jgi:hypothetical protein